MAKKPDAKNEPPTNIPDTAGTIPATETSKSDGVKPAPLAATDEAQQPEQQIGTEGTKNPPNAGNATTIIASGDLLGSLIGDASSSPLPPSAPPATNVVTETESDNDTPATDEPKGEWVCPKCGKKYDHRSWLTRHFRRSHAADADELTAAVPAATGKPGRKPGIPNKPKGPDFSDVTAAIATPDKPVNYELMSGMLFDMSVGTMSMVFGPEWQPKDGNERGMMVTSLKAYLESKQVKDIPPGMLLAVVCIAYSAPRLRQPATADKLKIGWTWFKFKVVPWFRRRRFQPHLTVMPSASESARP